MSLSMRPCLILYTVYGGQPSSKDSDEPVATITGAAPEVSKREVLWGLLEDARQQDKATDDGTHRGAWFSVSVRQDVYRVSPECQL